MGSLPYCLLIVYTGKNKCKPIKNDMETQKFTHMFQYGSKSQKINNFSNWKDP